MYTRLTPVTWEILYPNAEWNLHLEATKEGLRVHHDVIPWEQIESARETIFQSSRVCYKCGKPATIFMPSAEAIEAGEGLGNDGVDWCEACAEGTT